MSKRLILPIVFYLVFANGTISTPASDQAWRYIASPILNTKYASSVGNRFVPMMAMSNNGYIVGTVTDMKTRLSHAFCWKHGAFSLLPLPPPWSESYAWGVNDKGEIVGWVNKSDGTPAPALWRQGKLITQASIAGSALAIYDAGVVVGASEATQEAVIWKGEHIEGLPEADPSNSEALAISDSGIIVGDSGGQPAIWSGRSPVRLIALLKIIGEATAINNKGSVVGIEQEPNGRKSPFIYENGHVIRLPDLQGSTTVFIDDDGEVAANVRKNDRVFRENILLRNHNGTVTDIATTVRGLPAGFTLWRISAGNQKGEMVVEAAQGRKRKYFLLEPRHGG